MHKAVKLKVKTSSHYAANKHMLNTCRDKLVAGHAVTTVTQLFFFFWCYSFYYIRHLTFSISINENKNASCPIMNNSTSLQYPLT